MHLWDRTPSSLFRLPASISQSYLLGGGEAESSVRMAGDAEVPEAAGVATEVAEVPVDVVDVAAAAPTKKKKRSKAKKGGSGSSSGGWRIEERPGKGRCFIATRAFRVGELIVDEHPYAWVVLQRYLSQVPTAATRRISTTIKVDRLTPSMPMRVVA